MQTVRDEEGTEYLLMKQSGDASRVRDLDTGTEQYIPNERLAHVEGTPRLETAAASVSSSTQRLITAIRDTRSLGLVIEVVDRGPVSVIELLDEYELCESELHGLLGEFRAAGLFEETEVHGRRGYSATATAREAVADLQSTSGDAAESDTSNPADVSPEVESPGS